MEGEDKKVKQTLKEMVEVLMKEIVIEKEKFQIEYNNFLDQKAAAKKPKTTTATTQTVTTPPPTTPPTTAATTTNPNDDSKTRLISCLELLRLLSKANPSLVIEQAILIRSLFKFLLQVAQQQPLPTPPPATNSTATTIAMQKPIQVPMIASECLSRLGNILEVLLVVLRQQDQSFFDELESEMITAIQILGVPIIINSIKSLSVSVFHVTKNFSKIESLFISSLEILIREKQSISKSPSQQLVNQVRRSILICAFLYRYSFIFKIKSGFFFPIFYFFKFILIVFCFFHFYRSYICIFVS